VSGRLHALDTIVEVEARLGHGIARQVERVLIEHGVEIYGPRFAACGLGLQSYDQMGETVSARNMSSPGG
jgi:hypothetical protein